jgi:hypothetical protein
MAIAFSLAVMAAPSAFYASLTIDDSVRFSGASDVADRPGKSDKCSDLFEKHG